MYWYCGGMRACGKTLALRRFAERIKAMGICDKCLHGAVCSNYGESVVICASYKEQNTDNALCIYDWDVVCRYPIEDCRNCPARRKEEV